MNICIIGQTVDFEQCLEAAATVSASDISVISLVSDGGTPERSPGDAANTVAALSSADAVMALIVTDTANTDPHRDVYTQIGCAIGLGKRVMLVGARRKDVLLLQHPLVTEFDTVEQAIGAILTLPKPAKPYGDIDFYQLWTRRTAKYPATGTPTLQALAYCMLGDVGELGEFIDKVVPAIHAKLCVDENGTDASRMFIEIMHAVSAACRPAEDLKRLVRSGAMPLPSIGSIPTDLYEAVILEMGDRAWYWNRILDDMGIGASQVLGKNIEKLESRLSRGTLHGKGDNR